MLSMAGEPIDVARRLWEGLKAANTLSVIVLLILRGITI